MILILQTGHPNYRLRSYNDFVARLPLHYSDIRVYGPQYDGTENAPAHIIPKFHPGWTIDQVISEYIGKEPDALFIFSSTSLRHYGRSDFSRLSCPIYLLITDAVSWDDSRLAALRMHTTKPFRAVFHNYLWKLDALKTAVPAEQYVHYPCWSSHDYDYERFPAEKDLQFLISGVPGGAEYTHRDIFAAAVDGQGFRAKFKLGERTNEAEDNERFRRDLLRSQFSPHDGGINGRLVPRYAESCFARSVILSPDLGEEMRAAGYVNGKNCILFDRRAAPGVEATRMLIYATRTRFDRPELAEAAYDLARTRHCTDVRIRTFLEMAL
jgi:hypothetical protein